MRAVNTGLCGVFKRGAKCLCTQGWGRRDPDRKFSLEREKRQAERPQPWGPGRMHRNRRGEDGKDVFYNREWNGRVRSFLETRTLVPVDWANWRPFLQLGLNQGDGDKGGNATVLKGKYHYGSVANRICRLCYSFQLLLNFYCWWMCFHKTPKNFQRAKRNKVGSRREIVPFYLAMCIMDITENILDSSLSPSDLRRKCARWKSPA